MFRKDTRVEARSAGTSKRARHKVTVKDIRWADLILVMEEKHKSRMRGEFRDELRFKSVDVLDIPDEYQYMDPELVALINAKVELFL